jgi:hypothetical protein
MPTEDRLGIPITTNEDFGDYTATKQGLQMISMRVSTGRDGCQWGLPEKLAVALYFALDSNRTD